MNEIARTLLVDGPCRRAAAPFRLLQLTGPDAGEFLQRLCSQDVQALADGELAPAAFLDAKGKVQATCLVLRLDGGFCLEVHHEQVERLAALLERYHFSERLVIAPRDLGTCAEAVSSPNEEPASRGQAGWLAGEQRVLRLSFARRGMHFERLHGGAIESLQLGSSEQSVEVREMNDALAESLRMAAGIVRVGIDTEASTLALEAGLEDHCSTSKGCYTGQEIVARIHTYGHVNRRLCLLRLSDGPAIEAPVALHELDDGLAVGRVMHAVSAPGHDLRVGLGYLPKDFHAAGTKLQLAGGGDAVVVEVI